MKYCSYVSIAIFTFVLSALSVTFTAGDAQAEWTTETIDGSAGTNVGLYTSIAVSKKGKLDISYHDYTNGNLKYTTNRQGYWEISTVADSGSTGMYSSLVLSPIKFNSEPGELGTATKNFSYFDYKNGMLMYATIKRGDIKTYKVDSGFDYSDPEKEKASVGWFSSISNAVDLRPHIAYYDLTNKNLKYAFIRKRRGRSMTAESGDGDGGMDVGRYCSIVNVDVNGGCYISYRDDTNNNLKCATNVNGGWLIEEVASGAENDASGPTHNSIARDSSGNIHIAYYDNGNDKNLKYATNSSGSWVTSSVDDTVIDGADSRPYCGKYNSIAVDSSGYVHISYYDDSSNRDGQNLKYATNSSGSWEVTIVDSTDNVGLYTSLALGFSGEVYISYYDVTNGDLKLATYTE